MLKWLRKYNTYILVVGGCLLMVAFLLGNTLQDLTHRGIIGGKVLRVSGQKVTQEQYQEHMREYHALADLLGNPQAIQLAGGGENVDHWIMLTNEAQKGGFIGGQGSGQEFIPVISRYIVSQALANNPFVGQQQIEEQSANYAQGIEARIARAGADSRMSDQKILETLAKLHGVMRMRGQYYNSLRFSDRRLISGVKDLSDSVDLEFVLVPPDREMAGIPEPDAAAIQANFEKFKDTPKGGGEFGIGYKLPQRVKLAWLEINKQAISAAVTADPVEVQKAFLRKFPSGKPPEGINADDARKAIETEVKGQLVDKIMRTAEEVVRGDIGRVIGKLESDGEFRKLPADWATKRPDFVAIAADIVVRVNEVTGVRIPEPKVGIRDTSWQEARDLAALEGIGRSSIRSGNRNDQFSTLAFMVRELDPKSDLGLQVGVPSADALTDSSGNRFYFTILDARKESAPDTIDEIRPDIIRNIKRLIAFDKLKAQAEAFKARSIADGLEAIAKAPEGATGEAAIPLPLRTIAVEKTRTVPQAPDIDTEPFRNAVKSAAAAMDPTKDPKTLDPAARTVVQPIDKSLSLFVGRIKGLSPMTVERYRSLQQGMVSRIGANEMPREEASDPFTQANMEKRLNVEYLDGRKSTADKATEAPKSAAAQ